MEGLSIRIIFDRKGETKKDPQKKALVQVEVWDKVTRKKVYISTGVKILRSQYSDKGGFSIKSHPNATVLKATVNKIYHQVEGFMHSDKCTSIDQVKNWNKADEENLTTDIFAFIEEDLRKRKASSDTWEYNRSFLTRLREFGKIKTFKDITYANIEDFDLHLKKTIKSQPTLYKRHNLFKGYIEKARKRELLKYNPYDDFKVTKGRSKDPVYLLQSEVDRIIEYVPKGATEEIRETLERTKDLLLFQCFTGLSYKDVRTFTKKEIIEVNGREEIHGTRNKTGVPYVILLLPIVKDILEKYDYVLPVVSNDKYNEHLGTLMERIDIGKHVTTRTGRHTFGTYLINKGVSIEAIPKIMGHTNMKQSLLYARMLGVTAIKQMQDNLLNDDPEDDDDDD